MPLTALLLLSRPANSRSSKLIMKTSNPEKQSLKNSFLRSPLPISRNLPFFKPLLVSAVISLPSELFPKSVPIWRLFLRRNTCVHGLVLPRPTMKVQGRKNLSGFPRPDAISNLYWFSVRMLLSPVKSILKCVTVISVSENVAVTRKQSLQSQECFLPHYTTC